MKNLKIKNAARGLLGRKRKSWLLALVLLAAALPAAGMPREAYAEETEAVSEVVQVEEPETGSDETEIGESFSETGSSVGALSDPEDSTQETEKTPVREVKKNSKITNVPQKSLNTYAVIGTYGTKKIAGVSDSGDLAPYLTEAHLKQGNEDVEVGGTVIVGEYYTYSAHFKEKNEGDFQRHMEFQLPENVKCDQVTGMPFYDPNWVEVDESGNPILDGDGQPKKRVAGYYSVGADGKVTFDFEPDYMERTNKELELNLGLTVANSNGDKGTTFPWNDGVEQKFHTEVSSDVELEKEAVTYYPNGSKDADGNWEEGANTPCIKYTVKFEITKGMVKNPKLEDVMPDGLSYRAGSARIVVYEKDGKTPYVFPEGREPYLEKTDNGWEIRNLPDEMYKGQWVEITYLCDVDFKNENLKTEVNNGTVKFTVKNTVNLDYDLPEGKGHVEKSADAEENFDDKRLKKSGKLDDEHAADYPDNLDWEIEVGSGSTDMRGCTVKDELEGDHWINKDRPLELKWKDKNGITIQTYYIPWSEAESYGLKPKVKDGKIVGFEFTIPEEGTEKSANTSSSGNKFKTFWQGSKDDDNRKWQDGDRLKIEYYTKHDPVTEEEQKEGVRFKNSATVEGEIPSGVTGEVVIGVGTINKYLTEDRGDYLEYTVEFAIPDAEEFAALINDPTYKWPHGTGVPGDIYFYIQDQLEFKNVPYEKDGVEGKKRYFVDNNPVEISIHAIENESGTDIPFTQDGEVQQFFHVARIGTDYEDDDGTEKGIREFQIWFNAKEDKDDSRWTLMKACRLYVTYSIPTNTTLIREVDTGKTDDKGNKIYKYEKTDQTVRDLLDQGCTLTNEVEGRGNNTRISDTDEYTASQPGGEVVKSAKRKTLEDGQEVIEYRVTFNGYTEVAGTPGIITIDPETFYLEDFFDSRLEYVSGSLYLEVFSPDKLRRRYRFHYVETGENGPEFTDAGGITKLKAYAAGFTERMPNSDETKNDTASNLTEYMKDEEKGTLKENDALYVFTYQLKLKDESMKAEEITLNNEAYVHYNGKDEFDDASVTYTPDVLRKDGKVIPEEITTGDGQIITDETLREYTIDVNPGGTNMVVITREDGSVVYDSPNYTLIDTMSEELTLVEDLREPAYSIEVFEVKENGETGERLTRIADDSKVVAGGSEYVLQEFDDNSFKLVLPDNKRLRIVYRARITAKVGDSGTAVNEVRLESDATIMDRDDANYEVNNNSASALSNVPLKLWKRDAKTNRDIGSSVFKVYYGGEGKTDGDTLLNVKIGSSENEIFRQYGENLEPKDMEAATLSPASGYSGYYILLEEEAPPGYKPDSTPVVFKFGEVPKEGPEKVDVEYTKDGQKHTYEKVEVQYIHAGDNRIIFYNTPDVYELPETGGFGSMTYTLAGLLLMLGGAFCLMYRRNNIQKGGW